jgi:hypothetical protein
VTAAAEDGPAHAPGAIIELFRGCPHWSMVMKTPEKIAVLETPGGPVFVYRWRTGRVVLPLVLGLALMLYLVFGEVPVEAAVFGAALYLGVIYWAVAHLVNTTQYSLQAGRLSVRHTPLPWPGGANIDLAVLAELVVLDAPGDPETLLGWVVGENACQLEATWRDGSRRRLLPRLDAESAAFLQARIKKASNEAIKVVS